MFTTRLLIVVHMVIVIEWWKEVKDRPALTSLVVSVVASHYSLQAHLYEISLVFVILLEVFYKLLQGYSKCCCPYTVVRWITFKAFITRKLGNCASVSLIWVHYIVLQQLQLFLVLSILVQYGVTNLLHLFLSLPDSFFLPKGTFIYSLFFWRCVLLD